jgi:malonyl-CoA O-methyltransferase
LRDSGSTNRAAGRRQGLSGEAARQRFAQAIESNRVDGAVPVTLEVVYGHAWTGTGIKERDRGEFRIGVEAIGRRS